MRGRRIGLRWTIGDVSAHGFEALRLSVWGAWRVFGPDAALAVCLNTVPAAEVRRRAGPLPPGVRWIEASGTLPAFLARHVDGAMAEGVAWKFDPLRVFPDRWEISFDNDVILWRLPTAVDDWLREGDAETCLIAEDVAAFHGAFAAWAGDAPRNAGIRGLPPGFDLEATLRALLADNPVVMTSETDEQGLQVAVTMRAGPPRVVSVDEVAICSPFPPHRPAPGTHGAHFVGVNARSLPWTLDGRPATEHLADHWHRHRAALYARVGLPLPAAAATA